jgi:hypothetical protein
MMASKLWRGDIYVMEGEAFHEKGAWGKARKVFRLDPRLGLPTAVLTS